MSEFQNEFSDAELFNSTELRLSDYEDALVDPHLRKSNEMAREFEKSLNDGADIEVADAIATLEAEVAHLIGASGYISGALKIVSSPDGELEDVSGYKIRAQFMGFAAVPDRDDEDKVNLGYSFGVFQLEDDTYVTEELIDEISENGKARVSATVLPAFAHPDTIVLDLPITSPEQALAWLAVTYPETVAEIDSLILAKEVEGRLVPQRDDEALLRLKDFRLRRPDDITDQGWITYKNAVASYVLSLASVDGRAPYHTKVSGVNLVREGDADTDVEPEARYSSELSMWIDVEALVFVDEHHFDVDSSDESRIDTSSAVIFGLHGNEIREYQDDEPRKVTIPFASMETLVSLRNMEVDA